MKASNSHYKKGFADGLKHGDLIPCVGAEVTAALAQSAIETANHNRQSPYPEVSEYWRGWDAGVAHKATQEKRNDQV